MRARRAARIRLNSCLTSRMKGLLYLLLQQFLLTKFLSFGRTSWCRLSLGDFRAPDFASQDSVLIHPTHMALPQIGSLSKASTSAQKEVLDHLFEPCDALFSLLAPVFSEPLASYEALIEKCRAKLRDLKNSENSSPEVSPLIAKIVSAHPRLGPSKDALSSHSTSEQKSLAGTQEQAQKLADLNNAYEAKFQGLRFVVFVNGRSRDEIMKNMTRRIERGDIWAEVDEAFNAMCDIAHDRAKKLAKL